MSRLSQFFWAVNAKDYPTKQEQLVRYTAIDMEGETGRLIKQARRNKKKEDKSKVDRPESITIKER